MMGFLLYSQSPLWGPLAFALSSMLFLIFQYIPALGWMVGLFAITPLVLIFMEKGSYFFLLGNILFAGILLIGSGMGPMIFYLFGFSLPAYIIAEWTQKKRGMNHTILVSALIPLIAGGSVILILSMGQGESLIEVGEKHIGESLTGLIEYYKVSGMNEEEIQRLIDEKEMRTQTLLFIMPSLVGIGFLIMIFSNYLMVRFWYLKKGNSLFPAAPLSQWYLPDQAIWGMIGSIFLLLIPATFGRVIGGNLLIILLLLYFFQGFAILLHFFREKKLPYGMQIMAFVLIFVLPVLPLVMFLGIVDVWMDFRKVRVLGVEPVEPPQK